MTQLAMKVQNLSRRYGNRYAVQSLDLTVKVGDVYGFLGPNGAGKTTAMRAILGLIRRDSGSVEFFGESGEVAGRRHIGAIIEVPCFHEWLSGYANLELACAYAGLEKAKWSSEIDRVLERVGLADRATDRAGTYSLGMKQRLGIARALLGNPRMLMLDEPTNGLDPRGMREVRDLIRSLALHDQLTVLVSSHLLAEVQAICNRVGIINHGTLRAEGSVEELLQDAATAVLEIGGTDNKRIEDELNQMDGIRVLGPGTEGRIRVNHGDVDPSEINSVLVKKGIQINALVPIKKNLEDVFLEVTG